MRHSNQGGFREQFGFLKRQFLQEGDLPFASVLSEETITPALNAVDFAWKDRVCRPPVTLWVFLSQVISADHSCRGAVARLLAHRLASGLPAPLGRVPKHDKQKPGLGFPLARITAIFSLSCGAIMDLGICRYAGKGQGEISLFRTLRGFFQPGDVVLTDRLFGCWGVYKGRSDRTLSGPVECRIGFKERETNSADGYSALQNATISSQRNLDTYSRLQSHPHNHGASRNKA